MYGAWFQIPSVGFQPLLQKVSAKREELAILVAGVALRGESEEPINSCTGKDTVVLKMTNILQN